MVVRRAGERRCGVLVNRVYVAVVVGVDGRGEEWQRGSSERLLMTSTSGHHITLVQRAYTLYTF